MIKIRKAIEQDAGAILECIQGLGEHVNQSDLITATTDDILKTIFDQGSHVTVFVAENENKSICGYALIFKTFSTFKATTNFFIEDLFVFPKYRGLGIGTKMFDFIKDYAINKGAIKVEWYVNNANKEAIDYYKRIGAKVLDYKSINYFEV